MLNVLPDGTDVKVIKRLIGLIHLVGVNAWAPFEADGYYFREVQDLRDENVNLADSLAQVAKNYGVTFINSIFIIHRIFTNPNWIIYLFVFSDLFF